jgi:hypothetical protein
LFKPLFVLATTVSEGDADRTALSGAPHLTALSIPTPDSNPALTNDC